MLFRIKFLLIILLAINSELKASINDSLSSTKPRKNSVFVQILGDTPVVGVGYNRTIFEKKNYEIGVGLGYGTAIEDERFYCISHKIYLVKGVRKVRLLIAYHGSFTNINTLVLSSASKQIYTPSISLGCRISNKNNKFHIGLTSNLALISETSYFISNSEAMWKRKLFYLFPIPGISFAYTF